MKPVFSTLLLLGGLAGCSHDVPTPALPPALTGGVWTLQTESDLATPMDGTPPYTVVVAPMTGPVTLTYLSETRFSEDVASLPRASGYHFEGYYTYQGQTLTFPAFYSWNTRVLVPRAVQVTALSAHQLVTEYRWTGSDTWYVTTHTYTR